VYMAWRCIDGAARWTGLEKVSLCSLLMPNAGLSGRWTCLSPRAGHGERRVGSKGGGVGIPSASEPAGWEPKPMRQRDVSRVNGIRCLFLKISSDALLVRYAGRPGPTLSQPADGFEKSGGAVSDRH
jgi:hypothetical protein